MGELRKERQEVVVISVCLVKTLSRSCEIDTTVRRINDLVAIIDQYSNSTLVEIRPGIVADEDSCDDSTNG